MSRLSQRTRLYLGLACAAVLVALLAGVSLSSAKGFGDSERAVSALHDAIDSLNRAQDVLIGADDLQRRIVLRKEIPKTVSLAPDVREFHSRIAELDSSVRLLPGAHVHVSQLANIGNAKMANAVSVVDVYHAKGYGAALDVIRPGAGHELSANAAKEVGVLRQYLLDRLKAVAGESGEYHRDALRWLAAGLVVAAIWAICSSLLALIGARRRSEVEGSMRQLGALHTAILNSVSSSIIATDMDGNITVFNSRAEEMLGYDAVEVLGRMAPTAFHDPDEVAAQVSEAGESLDRPTVFGFHIFKWLAGREGHEAQEWTYVRKDGSRIPVRLSVHLVTGPGGESFGYVGGARDLTESKRTQETLAAYVKDIEVANQLANQQNRELKRSADELKQSRDAAVAATRMKSEFLANMSHEIRTPMNGVIGMVHLLMNTPLNDKQLGYTRSIQQSGESLLGILNDILDLSKMEAGKMTLENFPFDLRILLEDLCDVMAPSAHAKGLELNCVFPPVAPTRVIGDPGRLRQVLTNLLSNAIKFTDSGEVSVTVRVLRENQKRVTFRFTVADTGIGIGTDRQEKIFESFTQADGSTTRKYGGTGLGLTISRQLSELMGGEIGVSSNVGAGSEFWIEIAFQKQPTTPAEPQRPLQDLEGIRVLIADDNATNRFILREMLQSWNCRFSEAANGNEAISEISLSANDPFACVIMDLNMPGMDGLQAARALKRDPRHKDIPLILLSSSGFVPPDAESAQYFSSVLSKPVRTSPLFNAMSLVTGMTSAQESKPSNIGEILEKVLDGVRVLVVEDNAVNQMVVSELLDSWGCLVVTADNGLAAVEQTAKQEFDAILMDVQMPVMDGFEATGAIRAQEAPAERHTLIIAMTANAMAGDRERCIRAGMDGYLSKPLQPAALLEKLAEATGRQIIKPVSETDAPAPEISFDVERLDESCSQNLELKLKVIETFLTTSLDSLAEIDQSVAAGDVDSAKNAAHTLKGSSLTIGSNKVGLMCDEIEALAASGGIENEGPALVDALRGELLKVHSDLRAYAKTLGEF